MKQYTLFDSKPVIKNEIVEAIPYMGNKRKLATKILNTIYQTVGDFDRLYDLFGGGGSVSVAGIKSGHAVYYNELNTGVVNLLKYIQAGGELPTHWVSREEFNKHKHGDDWYSGFVKCVWSFGNNQSGYLFGEEIEENKRILHEIVVNKSTTLNDELLKISGVKIPDKILNVEGFSKRKILVMRFLKENKYTINNIWDNFHQDIDKHRLLQQLEQLEQLERLERLEQLEITNLGYNQVIVKPNSVIYCDPPYLGTAEYQEGGFDHNQFYKWCLENLNPVFVSEYNMPKEFIKIANFEHRSTLSAKSNNLVTENLYWNGKAL